MGFQMMNMPKSSRKYHLQLRKFSVGQIYSIKVEELFPQEFQYMNWDNVRGQI